jgi:hypothetical protein
VGFVEESTLDWLGHHDLEREDLVTLQERVLLSAIDNAMAVDGTPAR